ncbi:pyridoxal phosphate-dependent transferase [Microdochium trichocladiopsis]|uniref:Pyridoxal phosphate-dependent transferase n=1 Tax=Microdochium trichocladiopsis TaxID=1682393 RepID=A0A9P9BSK5_9PEZI|nr:pyridoxal phosphate-dependent transferase [Microdochium trichocladiopsis]KAH7034905.1 pyridoxal phosphate-dependent transferase [Microdochium trichocladiopsis]
MGRQQQQQHSHLQGLSFAARTIHAGDHLNSHHAVAPPMHVSTTFRYSDDPDKLSSWVNVNPANPHDSHVYSRDSAPNSTRLEAVLTSILQGPSLTYASGLAAFHAMLVYLNPRRVAIGGGYHGCHGVLKVLTKLNGLEQLDLDCPDEMLRPGDVIHVETPLNPTGEARDLEFYAAKARRAGAYLTVDATFAPPPLLDPLRWGADVVMHSGTKYFGGHSDMLCGVLTVNPKHADKWLPGLREERLVLGAVMGSLEGWLGVRSLRTLEIRVRKQSEDATALVAWLAARCAQGNNNNKEATNAGSSSSADDAIRRMVAGVKHASLQPEAKDPESWLARQMPRGYGGVFSILLKDTECARRLPSKLRLFDHATSLGGVESLIEWRAMTDKTVDPRLLRVSIGLEGWEDLRDDLVQGLQALIAEGR